MRKIIILTLSVLVTAIFSSCNNDEIEKPGTQGAPEIEMAIDGQLSFTFEKGERAIDYTIVNPVEGGRLTVSVPEDAMWLTATVAETCINVAVTENSMDDSRSAMLTLLYTYGDASVKNYINVIQETLEFDYVIDASSCVCTWYGNPEHNPDMTNYNLLLKTTDGVIVSLDLLAPEETEDQLSPVGEYIAYEYGSEEGLALSVGAYAYSYLYKITPDYDYEYDVTADLGSVVLVDRDGDTFTVKASIVAYETGQKFLVRYTGEMVADNGLINSSLKEDFSKTYNAAELGVTAFGGCYSQDGTDSKYWNVYIGPEDYKLGDPYVFMEFFTAGDITVPKKLVGVYTADPDFETNMAPNTFIPGSAGYSGTWFAEVGEITEISAYAGAEAPIMTGTFEFVLNTDGSLNLIIDGYDDNYIHPNHVYVEITNIDLGLYE